MSRNKLRMGQAPAGPIKLKTTGQRMLDSFRNFLTNTGLKTANASMGGTYDFSPISRDRLRVELAYRSSWICGMAVDTVAQDMTRRGVEIITDDDPETIQDFEKHVRLLRVWAQLCQTIKWSRLYGGAVALMMIDGQKTETPLRLDTIRRDQFKGLYALDRWALQPTLNELITDMGPDYGLPMYYDMVQDTIGGLPRIRIHHSRLIRFGGVELPYWQRISENLWGQSVFERLWDRLVAFDSTTQGAAQMAHKAHLRTYKVEGLRDMISAGGPAMKGLTGQLEMIRAYQSNEGMTLMDSKDEFEVHAYAFGGLSELMQEFAQQVSGALAIPMVRLLGQSPAGFSNGESDLRTYYDGILEQQETALRPGIEKLYHIMYLSKFGKAPPSSFKLEFRPLWQLNEEQRAQVTMAVTQSIVDAYDKQLIDRATGMKELRSLSDVTNVFSNISDESIKEAEADPAPSPEVLGLVAPKLPAPGANGGQPGGSAAASKSGTNGTGRARV